jgi:uncharacterized membrane protein
MTELKIAHLINLVLVSIFVGTNFAVSFFVHPVLSCLPQSVHIASVQVLGRILGKVMPIWIPLIIVSALPVLYFIDNTNSNAFWLTVAGTLCIVIMLGVTLLGNSPINKQVIEWNPQSPPDNWLELRNRWDNLHRVRVALDIVALIFLLLGVLVQIRN